MRNRICNKCKWIFFGVSRKYAEDEVNEFNTYFNNLSKQKQDDYYGGKPSSIKNYESCWCGNNYKNFSNAKPNDIPSGSTINPIIVEEE